MAKDKKHKQGDIIKITIGGLPDLPYINQPQQVEEHEYVCPPIPHDSDILYSHLPVKEQYWRRIDYPAIFYDFIPGITEVTKSEKELLYNCLAMELDRRTNGLWFMNKGVPTYITGNNHFHLQWGDMINGKPDKDGNAFPSYRKFQRDFFYFVDICEKDNNCLGGDIAKCKKVGATQMIASVYANEGTLYERFRLGLMSKTGDECKDTNMAMILHIIDRMPQIMLPKMGKRSVSEIYFGHPSQKPTGTKQYKEKVQELKEQKVLNSIIVAVNTKIGAFDGPKYNHIWFDEHTKYYQSMKISPKDLFDKDSAAVKLQQEIIGKVWITNYTPETDDKGFLEGKVIYYNSKKITINPDSILKRTKSNLFCYHISALYATEGTFDKYGEADVEKAFKVNDEERQASVGDINKFQALVRQGARHEDESWTSGGGGSVFDNTELQKSKNEKERLTFLKVPFYKRGNIEWIGEPYKSKLTFIDSIHGKWYVTRLLPDSYLNGFSIDDEGNITASDNIHTVGGIDPFSYKDTDIDGIVGGSKGVSYTIGLPNLVLDEYYRGLNPKDFFSKRIISWYSERPPNPNTFFEDMVKETLYFGKRILIENNKEWLVKLFKDKGLKSFLLMQNSETGIIEKYHPLKKQKEKSTQTGVVDEICRLIDEYFTKVNNESIYCMLLEDIECLSQLMIFNPLNTKPFDRVMALGYTLMALNSFTAKNMVSQKAPSKEMGKAIWKALQIG